MAPTAQTERRRALAQGLCLLAGSCVGTAAAQPAPASGFSAQLIKTGLYLISGPGGNTLMRFSSSGVILVDGQPAGSHRGLMSQVRRINKLGDLPTRLLVLTDARPQRSGTLPQVLQAGITVMAQHNTRQRLPDIAVPAGATAPVLAFEREHTLRLGGVEVRLLNFGSARSDGDAVVHFPDLKVVAVGDLFTQDQPEPDTTQGGSLAGWAAAMGQILALDVDTIVPGQGRPVGRDAVADFKARLEARARPA